MKRLKLENKDSIEQQIRCYIANNQEAKFIHRLQVVLMFAGKEDESCESLGALFGNSPRSISNWIKRLNRTGDINALRSRPIDGRPSRLTKEQKNELRTVLQGSPENRGIAGKRWNGRMLSSLIRERYGIVLRVRACQRLFHKLYSDNRK